MLDTVVMRQLGRPCTFLDNQVWRTSDRKQGSQMMCRESDSFILPMKWGNAHGGKEGTKYRPFKGNCYHTQR